MSAGIRPYHWSVPSAATKKNRQEKRRQKAETAAIIAAAGAGTVAATGASGKAVLDAADKGGQVATKTAGAMAVGATAATAVQIGTLMAALVAARGGMRWLSDMVKPDGKMSAEDIQQALKDEAAREEAFVEAMRERLERDMPEALAQADPDAAVEALLEREQRYMEAHEDAAAVRVEAAARRAQVKRLSPEGAYWVLGQNVKTHTPDCVAMAAVGWWPWEVLDDFNPPVHTGCECDLLTHGEAVRDGLLPIGAPPSTHRAVEKAEEIKRIHGLHESANQDYSDSAMVALYPDPELAVELALPDGETTDRLHMTLGYLGKTAEIGSLEDAIEAVRDWARKCPPLVGEISGYGVFVAGPEPVTYASVDIPDLPAARQGLVDALEGTGSPIKCDHGYTPHITLAYAARRPKIEARPASFHKVHLVWGDDHYVFALGAESDLQESRDLMELQWNRRYAKGTIWGGRFMPRRGGFAPRVSIKDMLRKLMGNDAPDVVSRGQQRTISAPDPTDLPTGGMRSTAKKVEAAAEKVEGAARKAEKAVKTAKPPKDLPGSAAAVFDRALARQHEIADKYGVKVTPLTPDSRPGKGAAPSGGGVRLENSDGTATIKIGQAEQDALNALDQVRASGGEAGDSLLGRAYDARRVINHELTHNTGAIRQAEYSANPDAFALEEGITEYLAHLRTIEDLKREGDHETLSWLRRNPDAFAAQGVYRRERAGLARLLDAAEVPAEERADFLTELSMTDNHEDRVRALATRLGKAQGLSHEQATDVVRGIMFTHGAEEWYGAVGSKHPERVEQLLGPLKASRDMDLAPDHTALAPDLSDLEIEDLGWKQGDTVAVGGRDEPYVGEVREAQRGADGRVYLTVEVPIRDESGKKVDSVIRYPDPDDVTKASGARPKTLKSEKVTGRVREGDQVRIRRNNGDIELAKIDRVLVSKPTNFAAEISFPDGRRERLNDTQVQDVRKATSLSKESKAPKESAPARPKIQGGTKQVTPQAVSGPQGYDPRRYQDPRRALLKKIQALPPGEELELADGSRIRRGDNHGSALIERPDGSTRRYATPARLANAESAGIEKRVGPRIHLDPKDGDPDKHGTLANQALKDAALDELTKGMASPVEGSTLDSEDTDYWTSLGDLLKDWQTDPRQAMDWAGDDQRAALQHAIKYGDPGEGPFWRGQAVEHAEPVESGRVRGWSRDLGIALDFAAGGLEARRTDGTRERVSGITDEHLHPGDVLMATLYRAEQADRGLDIGETLDEAERRAESAAEEEIEEEFDRQLPDAIGDAATGFLGQAIRGLDSQEIQAAFGAMPARWRDEQKDEPPIKALEKYIADIPGRERESLIEDIANLTGNEGIRDDWEEAKERAEDQLRDKVRENVHESRSFYWNDYEAEQEVILDNEALDGYQRLNVILAVGGQENDLSREALKAKVEEAVETGGYKFEDHEPAPGQMTFDDLNEPQYVRHDIDIATGEITTVPLGMASPAREGMASHPLFKAGKGKKYWKELAAKEAEFWDKAALKGMSKKERKEEKALQKRERQLLAKGDWFLMALNGSRNSRAWKLRAEARNLARLKPKDRETALTDFSFFGPGSVIRRQMATGMASPAQDGMNSPSLPDWLHWNKNKPKPRPAEQIERSMLEKPPEAIRGIPDFSHVELTDLKAAGGSNGARIATDAKGLRWLQKTYRGDRDRVATELLSNAIYRELGVPVSNAGVGSTQHPQHGETMALTYPLVDGELRHWTEPSEDLGEGFVADALLANWDVVGLDMDNVLWNGDTPIRLDQGGTLEFRAMGGSKEFGPVPAELWTMNQGSGQANGRMKITEASLKAQAADAAIRLTPERIDQLVDEAPFADEKMRERVRDALKSRVAWLDRFSRGEETLPKPREGREDVAGYFADRDADLEVYPDEEAALTDFLSNEEGIREEVDEHLQLQVPKEDASPEVARVVQNLDALLGFEGTRLREEVIAYVPLPAGIDPDSIDGKTFTERSYLPLSVDKPDGDSIKVTLPAGMHAVHPGSLTGDHSTVLTGRDTRLKIENRGGEVTALASEAPPKYAGFKGGFKGGMNSPPTSGELPDSLPSELPPNSSHRAEREAWLERQVEKNLEAHKASAEKVVEDIDKRVLTDPIDTLGWHLDPDKQQFTKSRAEFHKQQLEFMVGGTTPQENPRAIFMSGGSAAGKGTLQAAGVMDIPEDIVHADADEHKELIPEYQVAKATGDPERAAPMVHEESSYMSKVLSNVAIESRRNVLIDAVGGSKSYFNRIKDARDRGHDVEVNLVVTDPDVAFEQAASRAASTGRSVPVSTIYGSHRNVARTFDDSWVQEDSDGNPISDELEEPLTSLGVPITIWHGNSQTPIARVSSTGVITILDWDAWLKWREVAKRPHPAKDPEVQAKIKSLAG